MSAPPMPKVATPKKQAVTDLSYSAIDNMFTAFFANTPAGEQVWKVIAAQSEGTGKVLTAHVESTIRQIRAAGYSVAKEALPNDDGDELLAALAV